MDFKVEVINAGIPGGWSKVEVKFLKERLVKYEPDLFIIYDGVNDLAHANKPQEGPIIWKERWLEICNLGKETGFDTIITIQPVLGTGKRIPTDQEKTYGSVINTGNSGTYQLFVEQLKELNIFCTATSDLRGIFDNVSSTIFFDPVHVNSHGNKIVAEAFYEKSLPIVLKKSNDIANANEDVFKYQEKIDDDTSNIKNNLKLDDSVNTLRKFFLSYKTPRVMLNLLTVFSYEKPQQTIFDQKENEIQKQPLIGINFNGEDLSGLDFSNSDLENIIFYRANLTNVNFENSNLAGADFRFADITGINFQNAKMQGVNLSHLDLRDVDLSGLELSNVNLSYVNLSVKVG